ncbi:MAG: gluconolactonase [Alphaproteobacteria bacterium]|nr:gluconolactonase [Alphaproteobacteria bacterium]
MALTRRNMLTAGAAALASASAPWAHAAWAPSESYPDPAVEVLDPRFERYRIFSAGVERLATGMRWCEGPVWFGDGRYLVWSDIPNNRMMKWDEATGRVSVFRAPSNYSNGNCRDTRGRLITCEHLTRRISRTEYDGSITVVCDSYNGKRLNSPNDVTTKSDGSVWFSDPPYGIGGNYIGNKQESELPAYVYRVDANGQVSVVVEDFNRPNGICFSPDESKLYVTDSGARPNRLIRVFDVVDNGTKLANGRVFIDGQGGNPDGMRCDVDGNLWVGWGIGSAELNGVRVFAPDGTLIGRIRLPESSANLCFGGAKRNRLFVVASHSLYSLYVNTQGARVW